MQPPQPTWEINGLIRRNESGKLDFEKILQIVRELSTLNTFYPSHHFLLDHRESQPLLFGMDTIMNIAVEFVRLMPGFCNKIAAVIPKDPDSVFLAERFQACMMLYDYAFRFFTDVDQAVAWLSDGEKDL